MRVAIAGAVLGGGGGGLAGHASASTDGEWDLVSRCESGGDWSINTGNGYQGGLQFAPSTWSTYGGGQYASEAQRATKEQQIAVAERVLAQQGRGAWPVCGGALSGATPRNGQSAAPAPQPVVGTVSDAAAPVGADPPLDAETPEELQPPGAPAAIGPMAPTDAPLPPQVEAPIGVPELTVAPTGEQDAPVDSPPERPPSVSNAAAEFPGPDVALAAETQADNGTPQDAVLLPPAGPESSDASPEPTAQLVQASATVSAYDTAKEAALIALVHRYAGTPYISGGDSPAGTDCSGLASWLANIATGRPVFGDRFSTHNEEAELVERGFRYGAAPRTLVIGWNDHHTAITLADGTSVASGEGGGIRIGGGGAYQAQFDHHMYIPITRGPVNRASAPVDDKQASLDPPVPVEGGDL